MSFNKQILLFIVGMTLALLVGTYALNVSNTKTFLQNQLQSHASDTATSLGLSLNSVADPEHPAQMEAMIDAVYDRGHFLKIALHDLDGEVIYERANANVPYGVPEWFTRWLTIESPSAGSVVQNGWSPLGELTVQAHSGYAYSELWQAVQNLLFWFVVAALVAFLLAWLLVRALLKPLKKIELQARSIARKEYVYQDALPTTLEFRQVVMAMNEMVTKLKGVFEREAKMTQKFQRMAYQDSVTGLSNRDHFEMLMASRLNSDQGTSSGTMVMLRVNELKALNDAYGFEVGDAFMRDLAQTLLAVFACEDGVFARLNGAEIIAVLPGQSAGETQDTAAMLHDRLKTILHQLKIAPDTTSLSVALIPYQSGDTRPALLSQLAFALKQPEAQTDVAMADALQPAGTDEPDRDWSGLIESALDEKRFTLYQQSSRDRNGRIHDTELFVRMIDPEGTIHSAGYFMPTLEKQGWLHRLDKLVIELAGEHCRNTQSDALLAINLSQGFLNQAETIEQALAELKSFRKMDLAFEVSEHWIVNNQARAKAAFGQLKQMGFTVGVDHFGAHFSELNYLQAMRPHYIKLEGGFSDKIETDAQTQSYVTTVSEMAQSLDVTVIAMAVENEAQRQAYRDAGVSAFQGYLYGAPGPL